MNNSSGKIGERYVLQMLLEQGYTFIDANYHSRFGEIDIIVADDKYIVFVEVKYRSGNKWGTPQEAVTRQKKRRISNTALYYMTCYCKENDRQCRFDVLCTDGKEMTLYKNAFDYCGIQSFF